jgi:predicted alpha/beta-hydrolase family hydrolase
VARVVRTSLPLEDPSVPSVTAAVHEPDEVTGCAVLLTHGAGGDLDADGLVALAEVLAAAGHRVTRVNLPYREAGRRGTPRADRSVEPLRHIVASARDELDLDGPLILGGKSYGGRVASMAVADGEPAAGLVFYGYPLHPPGKPDRLRVDHWHAVAAPCLFLQGDRDSFSDPALLEDHLRKLPRRPTVVTVPGGDHSLKVTGAASPDGQPRSPRASIQAVGDRVVRWAASLDV